MAMTTREAQANWSETSPAELVEAHLQRPGNTARCYAADLATFTEFLRADDATAAVERLVSMSMGAAERTRHNYLAWLRNRYDALNTIRRKMMSVMGLLRLAHKFEVIAWALEPVKMPAGDPIRDTRGPGRQAVLAMLEICDGRDDAKGARDGAMLRLMAQCALRCNETLTLDVTHVDIDGREMEVLGKGLWGRMRHPMTVEAVEAIGRWLEFRGDAPGPLFTALTRSRHEPKRLTYWGAYDVVTGLGRKAGVACSPHKLRHFAATENLRLTGGNIPMAMALTRHRDPRTLMIYNDERMTRAREAMELVAAGVPHYRV